LVEGVIWRIGYAEAGKYRQFDAFCVSYFAAVTTVDTACSNIS
jgi:hypothetical protein